MYHSSDRRSEHVFDKPDAKLTSLRSVVDDVRTGPRYSGYDMQGCEGQASCKSDGSIVVHVFAHSVSGSLQQMLTPICEERGRYAG